jgi:hypothetical protein
MDMLETSAKSGENVLQAFEKLIGIVHDRALAASKNKTGIKGMSNGPNPTVKLEDNGSGQGDAADAGVCGC